MMNKPLYMVLIIVMAVGCQNVNSGHSQHEMANMKGMDMSNMKHDSAGMDSSLNTIISPVNEIVISNQETIHPAVKEFGGNITADGYIAFDERRNNKVAARFAGRIEKLIVKYNYQYVKKGEVIMEVYSPEILTMEEEYLYQLRNADDKILIKKAKERLLLLGIPESEILKIEKTGKPLETVSICSLYEGYVSFDAGSTMNTAATNSKQVEMSMGMSGITEKNAPQMSIAGTILKEGSYIIEGQTLFVVNDCREVWAIAAFEPKDEVSIKLNAPVTISSELAEKSIEANINFIEPLYKDRQKFTQARIYLKNPNQQYKINSLVSIEVFAGNKSLAVPSSSILDLGERKIVWLRIGTNRFRVRKVVTGQETNGFTEIISGITDKDEIAKYAGYLLDSESLIKNSLN